MSDPVVSIPAGAIAVPGLGVTYQIKFSDSHVLSFSAGMDQTMSREDMNEFFDRLSAVASRIEAKRDLPLCKEGLAKSLRLLPQARKALADALARSQARNVVRSDRRLPREIQMAPPDANAVTQAQAQVERVEDAIEHYRLRIPYLEAIIDGRDPPEPVAAEPMEMPILDAAE